MQATPSRHEVDQLLGLRVMLEDALRRAQHAGPHQRATATVLLDATVERATLLICATTGLHAPPKDSLDTLVTRVKEHLAGRWEPGVLPDVRQLHRARNAAQHEGLAPDRAQLPAWASAVERYVVTLVDAVFGVDVRRVVMSDAIVDPALRALIEAAETALAAGDLEASARASTAAFTTASDRWDTMHRAGQFDFRAPMLARGTSMHSQGQIDELRSVITTSALAVDPSEVAWFRAAAREPDVLDSDDVERMLSFAFGWVATFDLAQQSWVLDRRKRAEIAERLVRTGARPARVCEVVSMDSRVEGTFEVVFRLRDVPATDEYDDWANVLRSLLSGEGARGWWEVRPNGTVSVEFPEADGAAPVETLAAALADTAAELARARDEREVEQSAFEQRTLEYRRELAEHSVPTWVRSVEIQGALFPGPAREGLLLVVDESVATLVAPTVPTDGTRSPNPDRIHDLLRRHDFVQDLYSRNGFGNIQMRPVPTIDQLVEMLGDADLTMQGWLAWQREHDAERTAIVADLRAQITAAVDRASGDAS